MIWWLSMAFPHGKLSSSAWFSGICLATRLEFSDRRSRWWVPPCFVRKRRPFKISFLQLGELGQWPPWGVFFIPTTMVISPDLLVELHYYLRYRHTMTYVTHPESIPCIAGLLPIIVVPPFFFVTPKQMPKSFSRMLVWWCFPSFGIFCWGLLYMKVS